MPEPYRLKVAAPAARSVEKVPERIAAALRLLEDVTGGVDVVIPGHGAIGAADQVSARIAQDRAYVQALRDGDAPDDPRLGPSAYGRDFLPGVHERQLQALATK